MPDLFYQLLIHGDEVVAWLGSALAAVFVRYVIARIGHEGAREIAGRAAAEVFEAVEEVWQTYVSEIKAGNADGILTEEEKAEAKSRAIGIAKSNLGAKGLARLARALGMDSVDAWLGSRVESSVSKLKRAGKAVEVPFVEAS